MMTTDQAGRRFRLLTAHCVLWSLAMSLASGFVGAYLMRLGFSIAATVAMYGLMLTIRLSMRAVMLPVIRRFGMRRSLWLGAFISALQFLPLIRGETPLWLGVWILIVSAGECIYWPIYHAAVAMCGGHGRRGRQIALRQVACTATSVIGPVAGGFLLTRLGAGAEFGIASGLCIMSIAPLLWLGDLDLGCVPTARKSLRVADPIGLLAFAADGWICAGMSVAWPLILFSTLGSTYDALGWASSAAAIAGAMAGLGGGIAIDRGHRHSLSQWVTGALLLAIGLRVASAWAPWTAFAANVFGAAIGGLYYPVLMSVVYDRAKRSGSAYHFHLSAEAGWDSGAILGCLTTAAIAYSGVIPHLAVLPAALGVLVIHRCVRAETRVVSRPVIQNFAQAA